MQKILSVSITFEYVWDKSLETISEQSTLRKSTKTEELGRMIHPGKSALHCLQRLLFRSTLRLKGSNQ